MSVLKEVTTKSQEWLNSNIDQADKEIIKNYTETELIDSFYKDLEFGTGGLRGIMGIGTNRINKYTIGKATQGLANYLKSVFGNSQEIKVAIAHDSRNNSDFFTEITANVLAANGIKVLVFDELRPTPQLSYTVREKKCQCGIVITASHNPKEYNGYKVYWSDGGQIVAPHDKLIINSVNAINSIDEIKFTDDKSLIETLSSEIDNLYLNEISKLSVNPELIKKHANIGIVYTPIHGTGYRLVPECLKKIGFTNIYAVEEQNAPNGNFPTVKYPNPEEQDALQMAIDKAEKVNADIVMATDPDADRVGLAVRDNNGKMVLINGNQAATILFYYLLSEKKKKNQITDKSFMVKTIVTTDLLTTICNSFGVKIFDVLTGFKYIAEVIKENEGIGEFIAGGEESFGYLAGSFVRDKDAIISCSLLAEATAWAKEQNKTLLDILNDVYTQHGLYKEALVSLTKQGKQGADEINAIMSDFRNNPPKQIAGSTVALIKDFNNNSVLNIETGKTTETGLPKSNVLQFFLSNGSKISVRPSGTEPKIKFYVSVNTPVNNYNELLQKHQELDLRIENIKNDLIK